MKRHGIEPLERLENSVTYHVGGIICDEGESEGVLAVTANINPGPNFPESVRIVIGAPPASPLMEGYIPELDGFGMSVEVAERLVATVQQAIRDVRAETAVKAMPRPAAARDWSSMPIGTRAYSSIGGYWERVASGWRAQSGCVFPTPGGDVSHITPPPTDSRPVPQYGSGTGPRAQQAKRTK